MSANAHAVLSASSSKRWLTCTPSARLEQTLPEPKRPAGSFDFSAEGTLAHDLGEIKLKLHYNQITKEEYEERYAEIKKNFYYNEELENYTDVYSLYVRSQIGEYDKGLFEQRVDFSDWVPDGFGTSDVVILSERSIHIIDLKYGKGISVEAKDNTQLRLYALGSWNKFQEEYPNIKTVKYTIYQPRIDNISSDETTIEKLLDWSNYFVKQKAKRAWAGTGDFVPGDHCQFCRAKAQCKARTEFNNEIATLDFRPAPLLTDEEFDLVLSRIGDLKAWASDVEEFATQRAINDNIVPSGYKLYIPKGNRKIADPDLAVVILEEKGFNRADMFETKLKSVAQLEKLGQKGQVAATLGGLILRPEGTPRLVKDETLKEDFA
jgi:hypothetical protein